MMSRTPKHNWPELIAKFKGSSQTQAAFCQEQGLNPGYFNQKLNEGKKSFSDAFTKVERDTSQRSETRIVLQVGHCKVICPPTLPMESIAMLARSLA